MLRVGIIAAGGRGTRLGPLGDVVSKSILPYCGRPIIMEAVDLLEEVYGCDKIVVLTGHLSQQVAHVVTALSSGDQRVQFVRDLKEEGTLGAVRNQFPGLTNFAYCHSNISLGREARMRLGAALDHLEPGNSLLASSTWDIAPTHPHMRTEGDLVREVGTKSTVFGVCSVGTGLYSVAALDNSLTVGTPPLERGLRSSSLSSGLVHHVDIEDDWRHLEDLSFYK